MCLYLSSSCHAVLVLQMQYSFFFRKVVINVGAGKRALAGNGYSSSSSSSWRHRCSELERIFAALSPAPWASAALLGKTLL